MNRIDIIGGGPAGSTAAIAACQRGCAVRLFEKSVFPRHKVCGEFLSPEAAPVLKTLGVWQDFLEQRPVRITRVELHFRERQKTWTLAEPGWGLSRFALDHLLFQKAIAAGATPVREARSAGPSDGPVILAHGRQAAGRKGSRLFGFKAHFRAAPTDAVELYFPAGGYVGINPVEGGLIDICGIAPEPILRNLHFDFDCLLQRYPPLARRVAGMERSTEWLTTGPLVFGGRFEDVEGVYRAGDALGFVDPFTGSGILAAVLTGKMAGTAAAQRLPTAEHLRLCRQALERQYAAAGLMRAAIRVGLAGWLAPLLPGRLLFSFTRPRHNQAA